MSTLTEKVAKAAPYVLIQSPEAAETDAEQFIWNALRELGIVDDDISYEILMSNDCREGDARAVFSDIHKLPVPRFRTIWGILREGAEKEHTSELSTSNISVLKDIVQSNKPIGQYSNKELVERYSENSEDTAVEEELKKRSLGQNCIAFVDKNTINIELSLSLLAKAKRGFSVPSILKKDKSIYHVYPVGKFPEETYDVCPVTGDVLFDGYSQELGVTWEAEQECLQFIWLMHDQGIKIDAFTANNIQKLYINEGLNALKLQYPKIAEVYDELEDLSELPSLKTKSNMKSAKNADPFRKRF